jgi:hypothetical protein
LLDQKINVSSRKSNFILSYFGNEKNISVHFHDAGLNLREVSFSEGISEWTENWLATLKDFNPGDLTFKHTGHFLAIIFNC